MRKTGRFSKLKVNFTAVWERQRALSRRDVTDLPNSWVLECLFHPTCLQVFTSSCVGALLLPVFSHCWLWNRKGLSFTDPSSAFTPPMYLLTLANTYFVELNLLCSKLVLDSHQRFSCEILYLILCSDHREIFFFGSKHSLELMTTITFLTFSWPIFT